MNRFWALKDCHLVFAPCCARELPAGRSASPRDAVIKATAAIYYMSSEVNPGETRVN